MKVVILLNDQRYLNWLAREVANVKATFMNGRPMIVLTRSPQEALAEARGSRLRGEPILIVIDTFPYDDDCDDLYPVFPMLSYAIGCENPNAAVWLYGPAGPSYDMDLAPMNIDGYADMEHVSPKEMAEKIVSFVACGFERPDLRLSLICPILVKDASPMYF